MSRSASSMQQLVGKMAKVKIGESGPKVQAAPLQEQFPPRPAFGDKGKLVVLWANYFKVTTKLNVLYKYTIDVKEIKEGKEGKDEAAPEAKPKGKPRGPAKSQSKEVKGRKLYFVIQALLKQLCEADKSLILATEFKSQLVSLRQIDFPSNPMRLSIPAQGNPERLDTFEVTLHGPNEARVDAMMKYLGGSDDESGDQTFPRYPEVVDALNIIFGFGPRSRIDDISPVGSSRFFLVPSKGGIAQSLVSSNRPLQAMRGYFQSLRPSTGRLLLNANVTHGVFKLSGPVKDLFHHFRVEQVQRSNYQLMKRVKTVAKFLPKTRVLARMVVPDGKTGQMKTVYRPKSIHGLALASEVIRKKGEKPPQFNGDWEIAGPRNVRFWWEQEGQEARYISVYDYYQQKYGQTVDDRFPLLNLGSADRPTYFPVENVTLQEGQVAKVKLMKDETTNMLDFACRSPFANAFSITNDGREVLGLGDPSLARFGIAVDKKLLTVTGRVLQPPQVAYGGGKKVIVNRASWNMQRVQVVRPGTMIQKWTYVNMISGRKNPIVARAEVEKFSRFLTTMGIRIAVSPVAPPTEAITSSNELEKFFAWCKQANIQFILFTLENNDSVIYNRIKTLGDCQFGIATSCVQAFQLAKGSPAYFANVGLKWNLKAGGVNHSLAEELDLAKQSKTMVLGYDVTHPTNMPSGKADNIPSLVGVVATVDSAMGQWPSISWEQTSKQEMVDQGLTHAFKSRLELWQKHNMQKLPENIVIFRDGVSEGQFSQVLDKELPLIRAACEEKYKVSPRLTIVVSVKRHQTRFYPSVNSGDLDDGNRNILNGTVVDRGITQARIWDFFLTAHNAIKGTARPAHYTVLLDEIFRAKYGKEAANQLEKFTHGLCYLYGRATKAVSICPPAYYADIICTRARAHRPEYDVSDGESMTTAGGASPAKQVHPNLRDTMYYI